MRLFSSKIFFVILFFAFVFWHDSACALKYSLKLRAEITRAAVNGKPVSNSQKKYRFVAKDIIEVSGKPELVSPTKSSEKKEKERSKLIIPKNILEIAAKQKLEPLRIEPSETLEIPEVGKSKDTTFIDEEEVQKKIEESQEKESGNYLAVVDGDTSNAPMLTFNELSGSSAAKFLLAVSSVTPSTQLNESEIIKSKIAAKQVDLFRKPEAPKEILAPQVAKRAYIVSRGDSFGAIFSRMGYDANFIRDLSRVLIVDAGYNPSQIRFGQKFIFTEKVDSKGRNLISLEIPDGLNIIKVQKDANGRMTVSQGKKQVKSKYVFKEFSVSGSIIASGSRALVPSKVMADSSRIMSNKLDLSTQVYAGDKIEILYEQLFDNAGRIINSGRVFYVAVKGKRGTFEAFRFAPNGNEKLLDFYDPTGAAFRKSITNNPFPRRYRITSGFGYRVHPVLKRKMFHSGMDYGAPYGTPIPAAGDGVIVKMGRYGGYGNYIRIKHDGVWQTAYGHMSRYASGVRIWQKVSRGQIIGYVGSTGRSTGPHLHFETLQNGRQINPATAALPAGKRLWGRELTTFKSELSRIKQIVALRKQGS